MSKSKELVKTIVVDGPSRTLVDRLHATKFRILTLVCLVENPTVNVYEMDADAMKDWFEGYNEHAEYVLAIEPIDKSVLEFTK